MSNIFSAFKMAFKSMRANKGRTSLTILGIVIGIASIIIVYSAGEGIKGLLVSQVEAFGTNIIQSEIKVPTTKKGSSGDTQSATAMASGVQVTSMKLKDLEDGIWYFHSQYKNSIGWGDINHFRIQIDTRAPEPFSIDLIEEEKVENYQTKIKFSTTDAL
ncbi:MAG TPA: ABC transporter permease, partial [bacterium]|nr:ABC transporter permease [bacterium]